MKKKARLIEEPKKELQGVEGWLFFLALILSVISPIFIISQLASDPSTDSIMWTVNIITVIFGIFVGISIFLKKERVIVWAKSFFIFYLTISLLDFLIFMMASSESVDLFGAFRNVLVSIVWLAYLTNSERVKNTFKETKLYWKNIIIIVSVTITLYLIMIFAYAFLMPVQPIYDSLEPNYGTFHEFSNQQTTLIQEFKFNSDLPMDVYFVKSLEDYNNFMAGEDYNVYEGCFFEDKTFDKINCTVSTGGIIIYNPNSQTINYQIE